MKNILMKNIHKIDNLELFLRTVEIHAFGHAVTGAGSKNEVEHARTLFDENENSFWKAVWDWSFRDDKAVFFNDYLKKILLPDLIHLAQYYRSDKLRHTLDLMSRTAIAIRGSKSLLGVNNDYLLKFDEVTSEMQRFVTFLILSYNPQLDEPQLRQLKRSYHLADLKPSLYNKQMHPNNPISKR
jgi:hypothetical protein